jgi:hypothetical protein
MIYAYFIGGSMDLTKRAMSESRAPAVYYAALLEPLAGPYEPESAMAFSVQRERYRCMGEVYTAQQPHGHTFVYAYDGIGT